MSYDPESWHELFVMSGGAAAALAGLIFVAVSLNHDDILSNPVLPPLAMQTLGILVAVVLLSAFGLAPGQPPWVLGAELIAVGLAVTAVVAFTTLRVHRHLDNRWWVASHFILGAAATIPLLLGGLSLVVGGGGGLYWCLIEIVAGFVVAAYYAWVLLIEIRR